MSGLGSFVEPRTLRDMPEAAASKPARGRLAQAEAWDSFGLFESQDGLVGLKGPLIDPFLGPSC